MSWNNKWRTSIASKICFQLSNPKSTNPKIKTTIQKIRAKLLVKVYYPMNMLLWLCNQPNAAEKTSLPITIQSTHF